MKSIRQKVNDILKGIPERVFVPRWDLLYDALKKTGNLGKLEGLSYYDASREFGFGIACTRCRSYSETYPGVACESTTEGHSARTTYSTPFGDLHTVFTTSEELLRQGVRGLTTEFLIKDEKDIDAALYMLDHAEIVSRHDEIARELDQVGEDGIVAAQAGYTPYHEFMRVWTGYENSYYLMHDAPHRVDALLDALHEKFNKICDICLETPADIVTVDGHFNTMLIPPDMYKLHMFGVLKALGQTLHSKGKFMCSHTDAEMNGFLEMFLDTGFDVAEAYTPPPMTRTSLSKAYDAWNGKVTVWGGIASSMLSRETPEDEFLKHTEEIFRQTHGKKFIAGIGDNAPTDAPFERIVYLSKYFG